MRVCWSAHAVGHAPDVGASGGKGLVRMFALLSPVPRAQSGAQFCKKASTAPQNGSARACRKCIISSQPAGLPGAEWERIEKCCQKRVMLPNERRQDGTFYHERQPSPLLDLLCVAALSAGHMRHGSAPCDCLVQPQPPCDCPVQPPPLVSTLTK
eukprot:365096-Chlamydomonas_euryale.AAC.7